ncbi:hypothetical protein Vretifemale_20640 [Volvox reticuliferus]|uniref:Uncharacterized protein n=1 Tax=Volvox reticuliferus TaxID=1737510 RepID=A0A8J4D114_9CHLO|nr:hypothetical protein Vretifemale_20640 [Volvox reticuliferus]
MRRMVMGISQQMHSATSSCVIPKEEDITGSERDQETEEKGLCSFGGLDRVLRLRMETRRYYPRRRNLMRRGKGRAINLDSATFGGLNGRGHLEYRVGLPARTGPPLWPGADVMAANQVAMVVVCSPVHE